MTFSEAHKGASLELRTAAYFQAHGFLVRKGVSLSVAAGSAEVTDIDLLAIRYSVPLNEERLVADCKEKRRSRPFERILWTLGLATFSNATQKIVVTQRPPWQAREFASQGGVQILDQDTIDDYLTSNVGQFTPFGEASFLFSKRYSQNRAASSTVLREVLRNDLRLRQMLVLGHPITNINRIIKTLRTVNEEFNSNSAEAKWMQKYVSYNAAVIASVMLLRFICEIKWTPPSDWMDYARKRLTYGDVPRQKARQLARFALDQDWSDELPAPEYSDELIKLVDILAKDPWTSLHIPYVIDLQLMGCNLGDTPPTFWPSFITASREEILSTSRKLLSVLSYAANLPSDYWNHNKA